MILAVDRGELHDHQSDSINETKLTNSSVFVVDISDAERANVELFAVTTSSVPPFTSLE